VKKLLKLLMILLQKRTLRRKDKNPETLKYLIAGLGNIGEEYSGTRHNIGFMILDALAAASGMQFKDGRFAFTTSFKHKSRIFFLIKPSTYMNRSGRAVHYWLKKEKIPLERMLIVLDDIALPFGTIRLRPYGGDGGHNGLIHINQILSTSHYARLRFGIGSEFSPGGQVDYVLGAWARQEKEKLEDRIRLACDSILSFGCIGIERTMNEFNNR
jgi:PTH1 family peptidyl-tRNA hydrolase